MSLPLTVACTPTDRTAAILDGRIEINHCHVAPHGNSDAQAIFRGVLRDAAFDVAEMSMSTHIVMSGRADYAYVGLPVFLSRAFRHSSIYIRSGAGVSRPEDLSGKSIGLEQYQQTVALWVRGILGDVYGVKASSIDWVSGGLDQIGGGERATLELPPEIRLRHAGHACLNDMLLSGEVDAVVSTRPPAAFAAGDSRIQRLFPDYRVAEIDYFRKTGNFPIMHVLVLRRSLAEQHPWLARAVYDAFARAKAQALADLSAKNYLRVSMPWVAEEAMHAKQLMGERMWAYGVRLNRQELSHMLRYALADGLIARTMNPEDLFVDGVDQFEVD